MLEDKEKTTWGGGGLVRSKLVYGTAVLERILIHDFCWYVQGRARRHRVGFCCVWASGVPLQGCQHIFNSRSR